MFDTMEQADVDPSALWDDTELAAALTAEAEADLDSSDGVGTLADVLDALQPGVVLAAALSAIDTTRLSGHDRIVVLRAHQRMASHYQARLYDDMASIPGYLHQEDTIDPSLADEAAAAEIRAALRLTRRAADNELSFALALQRRLPDVWHALAAGRIDVRRAKTIINGTLHVPSSVARRVVDEILDEAPRLTTGQIAARLRTLCIAADPADAAHRYRDAVNDRRVMMEPTTSGTANLLGLNLPPHRVAAATRRVNHLAQSLRRPGEERTIDQLRADVLLDLLIGSHTGPTASRAAGVVDIRTDLATLTGLSDHPGELAGYGTVVADIARQVADEQVKGEWRWTVTHPDTGQPIATGITTRRPTRQQRREVETRDTTCVFPGCRMPATNCDLDHQIPWADDGPTHPANLVPLCRHDHNLKTIHGWHHQTYSDGDHEWTTPLGHRYTTSGRSP